MRKRRILMAYTDYHYTLNKGEHVGKASGKSVGKPRDFERVLQDSERGCWGDG